MVKLKNSEMRIISDAFISGGYVLNFSNATFAEFFEDQIDINIYDGKYSFEGTSKGSHLRAFVKAEGPAHVSHILRRLWAHKEEISSAEQLEEAARTKERLFELLSRLEAGLTRPVFTAPQRTWTSVELALRSRLETYLNTCSEDDLIEQILCPLFQQLQFQRITPAGHTDKALEYGKDVWMKYRLPTTHELYFGIQAKCGKLDAAGKSNANIAEIHAQALMMLGHPIFDPETSKEHLVDHAIIVCSGNITKQAKNWLGQKLSASQRSQILFMDRKDLLDLMLVHKVPLPASK